MSRIHFIQHQGKRILIEDYTNLRPGKEFLDTIAEAQRLITSQPPNSVLAVFDATGAGYDLEIINTLKSFVKANSPYIKRSAVVGIKGLLHIALTSLSNASGRQFPMFDDRESALAYLVKE